MFVYICLCNYVQDLSPFVSAMSYYRLELLSHSRIFSFIYKLIIVFSDCFIAKMARGKEEREYVESST